MTAQCSECLLSECLDAIIQHGKDDINVVARIIANKILTCLQRLSPRLIFRITEDTGRDQREADGVTVVFFCQNQGLRVRAVKQLGLVVSAILINRSYGVNNVLLREIKSGRDRGTSGFAAADSVTGGSQFVVSRFPKDCSADAASGSKRGVSCVDDGIGVEFRDADFLDFDTAYNCFHSTFRSEIHEIDSDADLIKAAFLFYVFDFRDQLFTGIHQP